MENMDGTQYWEKSEVNLYAGRISRLRVGEESQASDQERRRAGAAQELHGPLGIIFQAGEQVRIRNSRLRIMTWEPHNCPRAITEFQGPQTCSVVCSTISFIHEFIKHYSRPLVYQTLHNGLLGAQHGFQAWEFCLCGVNSNTV